MVNQSDFWSPYSTRKVCKEFLTNLGQVQDCTKLTFKFKCNICHQEILQQKTAAWYKFI